MTFWIEIALSQVVVLTQWHQAISTNKRIFAYFNCKGSFQVTIAHRSLKVLLFQFKLACNLRLNNPLLHASKSIRRKRILSSNFFCTPYCLKKSSNSVTPHKFNPTLFQGMLEQFKTLKAKIISLSPNLISKALHTVLAYIF